MNFDSADALRKSTGRGKSDVANKLVSMFLHEVSRRVCMAGGLWVSDVSYRAAVVEVFGHRCLYCNRDLERDRAAVEHLDGMNRSRVGLHIPGNVAMSCKRCNNEKRSDDQNILTSLADSGWKSFLAHNGSRCLGSCKTCAYWVQVWPDPLIRAAMLKQSTQHIDHFRKPFERFTLWAEQARPSIHHRVEELYRACQQFATDEIEKLSSELSFDFQSLKLERMDEN